MADPLAVFYLDDVQTRLGRLKALADDALSRVDDAVFFTALDDGGNSLAVLVKHLAGSTRSRWTDFLHSDGEKPDRNRDGEFAIGPEDTRAALTARWEAAWQCLFDALAALSPDDLMRMTYIRTEPHTVAGAINRQFYHSAYHVGQIVLLARHLAAGPWQSLSIPPGHSEAFNLMMREKHGT